MSETTSSKSYIDAHCHLADSHFASQLGAALKKSIDLGISEWIQGGIGPEDWEKQKEIKKLWKERIHLAFGLHPWWISQMGLTAVEAGFQELNRVLEEAEWLGEVGLDYLPKFLPSKKIQQDYFKKQLELSRECNKPLILHVVHAHEDALRMLKHYSHTWKGMVHAFSESKEIAEKYIELGFVISVGGACTRKGFTKLKEAIPFIPGEKLVIETDSPSQLIEPEYLLEIADQVAKMRGESRETVLERSTAILKGMISV